MADGKLRIIDGRYEILDGVVMKRTDGSSTVDRRGDFRIITITRNELVLSGQGDFKGMISKYERIAP